MVSILNGRHLDHSPSARQVGCNRRLHLKSTACNLNVEIKDRNLALCYPSQSRRPSDLIGGNTCAQSSVSHRHRYAFRDEHAFQFTFT